VIALLLKLHQRPVAWVAAIAAALWPLGGPGDLLWQAIETLRSGGELNSDAVLTTLIGALDGPLGAARALLGFAGWVALAAITLSADLRTFNAGVSFSRLLRTRAVGLMAATAVLFIPAYVLVVFLKKGNAWSEVGLAVLFSAWILWLALADRFALARFNSTQDRRAKDENDRSWNSPYYLNTGTPDPGSRTSIATGADDAVTDGGWALLGRNGLLLMLLFLVLDTLRVVAGVQLMVPIAITVGAEAALILSAACTRLFLKQ